MMQNARVLILQNRYCVVFHHSLVEAYSIIAIMQKDKLLGNAIKLLLAFLGPYAGLVY